MSDNTVVHIGENSPEHVAFNLMKEIASVEGRELYSHGSNPANRKWVLDTYAECLKAVRGFRKIDG
ncbi:MAG: hypothetical protein RID11_03800 [Roseovarius sp.]|jgi:hypothetical protein|uniref:hypothetical protein n=1 Tax=Roseovarius sp. TaxID=1486281 RepID=UPI0032EF85C8